MSESSYDSALADIRAIEGSQGSGKTCSSVAIVVDECYSNLNGILNPSTGEFYKARALNEDEIKFLQSKKIAYHHLKHVRVFSNNDKSSKIMAKPKGWVIQSPIKVFANFHFFGIRHEFIGMSEIIENINSDRFTDGFVIFDETSITDRRDTMTSEGKMTAAFAAQVRRRRLHMIVIAQTLNMIQSRFLLFATTRVSCSYDADTHIIDLDVNEKSPYMNSVQYYAPDYWKFYKHDEIVKMPQHKVDKLMAKING
jgi:hypothetical protein